MSSASLELQDLVLARLRADAAIAAIVGTRIHDGTAAKPYPAITLGASDWVPDEADCIDGRVETLQIDCWTEAGGKLWPARQLADLVAASLHDYAGEMTVHALAEIRVVLVRVLRDPGGIVGHGVVQVAAMIEAP